MHADKDLITLFESEVHNLTEDSTMDNADVACPRLVDGSEARRVHVPAEFISWDVPWDGYKPPEVRYDIQFTIPLLCYPTSCRF